MSTVVFLGGGRITSAMLAGLRLAKTRHRLVVHDRNPGKLRDLKKRYAVAVEPDLNSAVKQAEVLIVAVRPSSVREVLRATRQRNRRHGSAIARGQPGGGCAAARTEQTGRPTRAMGPCHAKPALPQRPRPDRGDLSPDSAARESQTRPRSFRQLRSGRRNSGKQIRCIHRDLLMQPWLSCARDSGANWPSGRS